MFGQGELFKTRRLFTGPPGSGKSHAVLALWRTSRTLFVVPTLSFREHTRNTLLRMNPGSMLEGRGVVTFEELMAAPPEFSSVRRTLLVERLLRESDIPHFRAVRDFPGFRETLANEADEAIDNATDHATGHATDHTMESRVKPRGDTPRGRAFLDFLGRYARATAPFRRPAGTSATADLVLVDGFTDFTPAQKQVLAQLAGRAAQTVVTIPESRLDARRMLTEELGFAEERLTGSFREPQRDAIVCDNRRDEVEWTSRNILQLVRQHGYQYREIGMIVQNPTAYLGTITDVFRGLGIPARLFFPTAAMDTSLGRHLMACLRLLRAAPEEENAARLDLLKSAWGKSENREWVARKEFEVAAGKLARVPLDWERPPLPRNVAAMARAVLDSWELLTCFGEMATASDHARALELRADALARRRAWELPGEIAEAARAEGVSLTFPAFIEMVERELRQVRFRVRDRRTDAVNVMNAYEARQWELRAVFVMGMVEGEFPRPPRAPLFLPDTSSEQAREQEYLFEVATTRARERLTITWPKADARGVDLAPSRFVAELKFDEPAPRTRPVVQPLRREATRLRLPASLAAMRAHELVFSPSGLRTFNDCAFKHFAQFRMHLKGRPRQEQGLTPKLRGDIVHAAIMEWDRGGRVEDIGTIFERMFESQTRDLTGVHDSHTAKKMRAAMLADLRNFEISEQSRGETYRTDVDPAYVEKDFIFPFTLPDGTTVELKGRVDRVELRGDIGLAVDFKYSATPYKLTKLQEALTQEYQVAAYLLALQHWGLRPAGMEFQNLRGDARRVGVLDVSLTVEVLHGKTPKHTVPKVASDVMEVGVQRMSSVAASIRAGVIEVNPRDPKRCKVGIGGCDFYDLCRVSKWRLP